MKISIGVVAGINKTECEDTIFYNHTVINSGICESTFQELDCVGVADGVEGNAGGGEASRYLAAHFIQTDFSQMSKIQILEFVKCLNRNLICFAHNIKGKNKMATTLTCVVAAKDGFYLIHAGNTRMYIVQGAYLNQLTSDQTTYQWLLEQGQTETAAFFPKNEINSCFGGGNTRYADKIIVEKLFDVLPGTFLLTSDGVHDYMDIDFMEEVLNAEHSNLEIVRKLITQAEINGSTDDKTVILISR